jgi:NitT/TauT family transport system permease protein
MPEFRARIAALAWPVSGLLFLVLLWQVVTQAGIVPGFLLPSPGAVLRALLRAAGEGTLWRHLSPTLTATVTGYVIGCTVAAAMAALIAEFRWVERALMLHLLALQSIPKVSVAPLVFLWAGFDIGGKVVLVALICFFPVFANTLAGLRATDADRLDLLRAAGASRWHVLWHLKLPSAARSMFAGLEISTAFALIGCVVMEFIGATRGMGFLIQDASSTYDLPLSFAAIVTLGGIGLLANAGVRLLRRRLLFWELEAGPVPSTPGAAGG